MKQHSFAFYSGFLNTQYRKLLLADETLRDYINAGKESGDELDQDILSRMEGIRKDIQKSITSSSGKLVYPANVTWANYLQYLFFPTVVYELDYPRTDHIRWNYVLQKACATFGTMGIMILTIEEFIFPALPSGTKYMAVPEKMELFGNLFVKLMAPFLVLYLCVFFVIFESILNGVAELTRFADRGFYGPWWNSVTWDEFARDWNRPVHQFLLRHVYYEFTSHLPKTSATLLTFFISACLHELVMACIWRKVRAYLFIFQMMQLPLVWISNTSLLKNKRTLNNCIFW